jgi:transcriptional regulator with XRE-family HTH domain
LNTSLGRRLKRLRKEKGLTQKELASRVPGGIDYTYIGKIERGEQLPSLKILSAISDVLDVPLGYFFREEEAAVADIFANELRILIGEENGLALLRAMRLLHPDDIPLVTEIIKVLHRHRTAAENSHGAWCALPSAAEEKDAYGDE